MASWTYTSMDGIDKSCILINKTMNKQTFVQAISLIVESDDNSDIENTLFESSSSSDDEETDVAVYNALIKLHTQRGELVLRPRIENYMEIVVPMYSAEEFKSHFRLYPATFEFVLGVIGPTISRTTTVSGRKPIEAKKQLLLSLWAMATPDSIRSICEKFNVGKATAIRSLRRVTYALHCVAPRFIQWPTGERAREVMVQFEKFSAFPRVIGAIDGTHIKIKAPASDAKSYINRKNYHSIQVQAVCTQQLLFTSVFAGNAGCVHDARIFRLSPVQGYIEAPDVYFPDGSHVIGDAAYGINSHIMTPFKDNGHLSARQKNFNFCLSSARISIERAFGLWKGRWRSILDCLPMTTLDKIPEYLLATCVLHNICILKGDLVPFDETVRVRRRGRLIAVNDVNGALKRTEIMNNLIMRDN